MGNETRGQSVQVSQTPSGQGSVSAPIPLNGLKHYRPGILIFSRRQTLLYLNRRAVELTGHLDQAEIGAVCEIPSTPVSELRSAIQAGLDHRRTVEIWEIFELKRILVEAQRRILMRGFGLANRNSHDDSRIVIVLEELGLPQERCETGGQVSGLFQDRRGGGGPGSSQAGGRSRGGGCVPVRGGRHDKAAGQN